MKFLDANVFLFAELDMGRRGERSRTLLARVSEASPAATNAIALNEVFWNLRKPRGREPALRLSLRLAQAAGLRILAIGPREWRRALHLMTEHPQLEPNDAVHAASALENGIKTIVSSDPDFDAVKDLLREPLEPSG